VARSSELIAPEVEVGVNAADPALRYVSRGGLKLELALAQLLSLGWRASESVALDVGQSTGGFTDCLLQHGVKTVVGVDVGHGQLHPRLAADPRVRAFEGINARALEAAMLGDSVPAEGFGLVTIDVSFIALDAVLAPVVALIQNGGWLVALIKPQFELGPTARDRHGIVRDGSLYGPLLERIAATCAALSCVVSETLESPLTGGAGGDEGNREFLLIAQKRGCDGSRQL
jgi:23S rRNA (cytidine1920-2'-O)/16S rRNA (cytidine1409-2'-O)-methyltransferase